MRLYISLLSLFALSWLTSAEDNLIGNVPDNWRKEVFYFPLEFAPTIELIGSEEVHFAPGMFDPNAPDYFNYIFLWHLKGKHDFESSQYEFFLKEYYKGLYLAVSKTAKGDKSENASNFAYKQVNENRTTFTGEWLDAFNNDNPVQLIIEIEAAYCPAQNISNILFRITSADHKAAQPLLQKMTKPQC
jgi:hypothetical protein